MTVYTFSLSRAHAVVGRLSKLAEAKRDEAQNTLSGVTLNNAPTDEQAAAFATRGLRALEALNEAIEGIRVVGRIRQLLAEANAKHGVSQLLSEIEAKKHEARLLTQISAIDLLTMVPIASAGTVLKERAADSSVLGRSSVRVSLVPINALDDFRQKKTLLNANISALTDQVADLNKNTISVELPEKLAEEAGL